MRDLVGDAAAIPDGEYRLTLACERCGDCRWLPTAQPQLRTWLAARYPRYGFAPALPRRRAVLLQRMPHGSRWVANARELATAAADAGWELHEVWRSCSYTGTLPAALNGAGPGIRAAELLAADA
eukprot:gene33786-12682_t